MRIRKFILITVILYISLKSILFVRSGSVLTNTVLCSFNTNEINIQSTKGDTQCSFLDKNNSSGLCFDNNGNSCTPSIDNNYSCSLNSFYLTCVGPSNIKCTSLFSSCSIVKNKFYGNNKLLTTNQFTSKESGSAASSVSPLKLLSFLLFTILVLLF